MSICAPVFWHVILIGSCCAQFTVDAWAEAAVPLAVYFIPALIKVKFQLCPISTHLSLSVEAAVWFGFSFFSFQLPDLDLNTLLFTGKQSDASFKSTLCTSISSFL